MSRPKKQTVDYFPHKCTHGRVMTIIQQEFKNDGYAFRYKLQEVLGLTDGHYLDCRDTATWRFLLAHTMVQADTAEAILLLLSDLGEIDKELWASKIIWSENFVNDIADAYRNRIVDTPSRPTFLLNNSPSHGVSYVRNPQTKQDNTIENKTKLNESVTAPTREEIFDLFEKYLPIKFPEYDKDIRAAEDKTTDEFQQEIELNKNNESKLLSIKKSFEKKKNNFAARRGDIVGGYVDTFYSHYKSVGWVDGQKRKIVSVEDKVVNWIIGDAKKARKESHAKK